MLISFKAYIECLTSLIFKQIFLDLLIEKIEGETILCGDCGKCFNDDNNLKIHYKKYMKKKK